MKRTLFSPGPCRSILAAAALVAPFFALGCGQRGSGAAASTIAISLQPASDRSPVLELTGLPDATLDALERLDASEWPNVLAVRVRQEGVEPAEVPPVLGSYEVVGGGVVRFTPMFPFVPGQPYDVTFDPTHLPGAGASGAVGGVAGPVRAAVALPKPVVDPTTVVERVYPTASTLPENQLKLYIRFSAPMSAVDGLPYIHLLDHGGNEVEVPFLPLGQEFWDRERVRYTVFFDPGRVKRGILSNEQLGRPLRAGETYTLLIDQAWPDAEGNPLKEPFRRKFTVGPADEEPLDPATWTIDIPPAGTRQRLVVSFPEAIDHGLLMRAVGVEGPDQEMVDGDVEISGEETRWTFTPTRPWVSGRYHLIALSILEDLAGNQIGVPFEVDVFRPPAENEAEDIQRLPFEIRGVPSP